MKSLARKFLISVGVMTVSVTAIASVAAFAAFQHELVQHQIAFLSQYVQERANKEGPRFSDLVSLHVTADGAMRRRIAALDDAKTDRLYNRLYPLRPDGTRRSAPNSFDGMTTEDGHVSYGMGAFLSRPSEIGMAEKKVLVAAYSVVSEFGEASHGSYDNFYFFTPKTRLVMFGPDRKDRLDKYRNSAPASFDVSKEEMVEITRPENNPRRVTRCTKLRALLSDATQARMAVSCSTPFDIDGRHVGAFGSSIALGGYLANAVSQTVPGASNLIVSADGDLIAYPGFSKPGVASAQTVDRFEHDMQLRETVQVIKAQHQASGVVVSPDGDRIVAFGRLAGPDWWFLISYPRAALAWSAAKSAAWILVLGFIASILQTALVMALARRAIVKPLQRLADSAGWRGRKRRRRAAEVSDIEQRPDEIGALARALNAERRKVETLLSSLEDRVRRRTAELEHANREKSRFLANMSHELRTPLNGVVAVSEVLAREQKTKRTRELAELVASSGRLLEQVLTDILDFSKIEAGQMTLEHGVLEVEPLIGRIAELHKAVAEQKGLSFRWSVAADVAGRWNGDAVRITQVLSNLLSNAVKFTEKGEVRLLADAVREGLRIRVTDTGVGFDEAARGRLFNRFQQADASVTRRYGGTGLGLAISASLVELMGGRIEAESTPGAGSTFTLILPLTRAVDTGADEGVAPDRSEVLLAGVRVLLAEDHPTNQKVARLILEAAGVEMTVVENGRAALDAWRAGGFDLILMDMQMPEMDGLTATREIRAVELSEGRARTPILMLTANALDEHVRASLEAGADRHVSKPLRPDLLIGAVSEALQPDETAAAA